MKTMAVGTAPESENGKPAAKRQRLALEETAHFNEPFGDPEVDNVRIRKIQAMIYPQLLMDEYPETRFTKELVCRTRKDIANTINGDDDRLVVIVGPCSIHDPKAALEYAQRLKAEAKAHEKDLIVVMRVYFEKPRTTVGWKGLINDPYLDGSFQVNAGLRTARKLLCDINELGVPVGCEFLDTMTPQYIADLVAWAAIGARTTECQPHRELSSGLSMPVGFKNGTSGDLDVAVDAVIAGQHPHTFLSVTKQGNIAIIHSGSNPDTHVILRGGKTGPNHDEENVKICQQKLAKKKLPEKIMIDCSHGIFSIDQII